MTGQTTVKMGKKEKKEQPTERQQESRVEAQWNSTAKWVNKEHIDPHWIWLLSNAG